MTLTKMRQDRNGQASYCRCQTWETPDQRKALASALQRGKKKKDQ
jgi:hypothetical protein